MTDALGHWPVSRFIFFRRVGKIFTAREDVGRNNFLGSAMDGSSMNDSPNMFLSRHSE